MLKRVAILLFCLMMIFIATFGFVVGVVSVPTIYSYAAVNDDSIYVPLRDPSDLVIGFQAYCKSRDLTIEGSLSDAVTTFTTGAFNSACNELGINISQLQAEIKAEYDQSGKPVKFLFNDTGVMAMNRIFAQFLQDNELQVGDQVDDQNVYDGYMFVDDDGYTSLVWIVSQEYTINGTSNASFEDSYILSRGTYHKYDTSQLVSLYGNSPVINAFNNHYSIPMYLENDKYGDKQLYSFASASNKYINVIYADDVRQDSNLYHFSGDGYPIVYSIEGTNKLYIGRYSSGKSMWGSSATTYNRFYGAIKPLESNQDHTNDLTLINIYFTTNNQTINNNNYEGDTYITNEGDVIVEPDPVPPGGNDPGWDIGGGGGTATDGDGNTWNIQFPDFQLPDLNIDWSINGLGEKFPFSIPFDLVSLVTVLNAEPEAPRFEGTVNFGFTTWDYDINLEQFDSVAQACRIAELLLLVVGLILITRSIIKG